MSAHSSRSLVYGALVSGSIYLVWIILFYYLPLFHPGSYLFDLEGDGIVNYYTFLWHIKYDTSLMSFGGMHYPYGEYLPYVDCHPALSSLLQLLQRPGIDIASFALPLLNLVMLTSGVIASVFLYLVLKQLNVNTWRASFAAPAIIALSSQVLLMQFGHYALSYTLFLPMGWYLLLKYNEHPESLKWSLLLILNALLWSYTHNYLGAIIIGFTAMSHLAFFFNRKEARISGREWFLRSSHVILPALFVYVVAVALDPHSGRVELPFDPDHTASFYSVFVPNYSFTRPFFSLVLDLGPQEVQSWARVGNYVGIPSLIAIITLLVIGLQKLIFRRSLITGAASELFPYLSAATILLLISMGWHFRLTGAGWLEFIPVIKQFHGLGRFAWAFYYVICVAAIVLIEQVRRPMPKNILLILAVGLYLGEAFGYHQYVSKRIVEAPNYFDPQIPQNAELRQLASAVNSDDYQAIVPLPFYHLSLTPGTFNAPDTAIYTSMRFAWMSGLPLVSAMLSRYSIDEGRRIIELFSPNQYVKPIKQDFQDTRPFLLFLTDDPLEAAELDVAGRADTLARVGRLVIASLPFDGFFDYPHDKVIREFHEAYDTLKYTKDTWRLSDTTGHFKFNGFDELKSDQVYRGTGAWSGDIGEKHILFTSEPLHVDLDYELSFWYYNVGYDQVYNHMWVEEWNSRDSVISRAYLSPTTGPISDGPWFWNVRYGKVSTEGGRIVLKSEGERRYDDTFYLDELMFREKSLNAYRISESGVDRTYLLDNQTIARGR